MIASESLLLAFLGAHVRDRGEAVAVASIIDVLARLGVGEHATRATLNRMSRRGLLANVRQGRQAFLSLTPRAEEILREGSVRLETEVVNRSWDGQWTLLAFSVPESRRADRHALRTQLTWAGFGLLKNGLWIAPSPGDVQHALAELDLLDYVRIFRAEAVLPADPRTLVAEAWDLNALADGYRDFLARWSRGARRGPDDLSRRVLLEAEWLLLIRTDPRLPVALLPANWPGLRAEELFWSLRRDLDAPARRQADATLHWLALPAEA